MQLGSEGTVIPLLAAGLEQRQLGDQENSIFIAQKAINWCVIYSVFA